MNWQGYWKWLVYSLLGLCALLMCIIGVIDPYDSLPFSPPLERMPLARNQRYSYPAIARDPTFDSALIGTSTSRPLRPDALNKALNARFANFSMDSARAYEQARLLEVFLRHHPAPKFVILGLDVVWCEVGELLDKYTIFHFPEWMYDRNPWNDLPQLLELKTLEVAVRQVAHLFGNGEVVYRDDGYADSMPSEREYDIDRVRKKIYGKHKSGYREAPKNPPTAIELERTSWTYPAHTLLEQILNRLPDTTRKILFFVPYHQFKWPAPNTEDAIRWEECKIRVGKMAGRHSNTVVLDFMISSPITTRDENYWDVLHYKTEIADRLIRLIATGNSGKAAPDGEYVFLNR